MNKLNPIYIVALLVVVFFTSLNILNNKKEEYKSLDSDFNRLKVDGKTFSEYKNNWFNINEITLKLDKILKNPILKNEKITKTQTSNLIRVKIESGNSRALNNFLNRVLNEKFILKKIDIQKRSIYFEIGLR